MKAHSNPAGRATQAPARPTRLPKPARPDGFPLFAHATKRWAKKVRGRLHYFGPWADPQGALQKWLDEKGDLLLGRRPKAATGELDVRALLNVFLNSKRRRVDSGELSARTFAAYRSTTDTLAAVFGLNTLVSDLVAEDFERLRAAFAKRYGVVRLCCEISVTRMVFRHGFESGLMAVPVRFGDFKKPTASVLRRHKAANGEHLFSREELHRILAEARQPLRTMILLGLNAGLGNSDIGKLPLSALDLEGRWLTFPRPKTGISRRASLWGETVSALKDWLAERPKTKKADMAGLVFVTHRGGPWATDEARGSAVGGEFAKLLDKLGLHRPRLGFYTLRHVHRTQADNAKDPVACDLIMGHAPQGMAAVYRQKLDDGRLVAVAEVVRTWLFGQATPAEAKK